MLMGIHAFQITKAGVPADKIVVGVTSYGRSFAMADASCHTEQCQFTGTRLESNAKKGPCTDTAGYISDAEIKDVIRSGRINHNYIDITSHTNIIVYDDTEWIGFMTPDMKDVRKNYYKELGMGGITDWASDLEDYNDPPLHMGSWKAFIRTAEKGLDPYQVGTRSGNWTELTCTDRSVEDLRQLTPKQRWDMMDCQDAWNDALNVWRNIDIGKRPFSRSISDTFHGPEMGACGNLLDTNNCQQTLQCDPFIGSGTGPAAYELYNSLALVHEVCAGYFLVQVGKLTESECLFQMYSGFYNALFKAAAVVIDPALKDFENKFSTTTPAPSDIWLIVLLDFAGLGLIMVGAPYFNFGECPEPASSSADI